MMAEFPSYPWRVGDRALWLRRPHEVISTKGQRCVVVPVGGGVESAMPQSWLAPCELPPGTVVRDRGSGLEWRVGREPLVGVWEPQFGTFTVDVFAWPPRCAQCGLFGHERCVAVPWRATAPPAPTKGPNEGAALCARCGRDRILIANRRGQDFDVVHGGPCEPVRACGHRDEVEARWFEGSTWHSGCRECATLHAPEED